MRSPFLAKNLAISVQPYLQLVELEYQQRSEGHCSRRKLTTKVGQRSGEETVNLL